MGRKRFHKMDKVVVVGIIGLLILIIGGLFYYEILEFNSPTGLVVDSPSKDVANNQNNGNREYIASTDNYKDTITEEERRQKFADDYFSAINDWIVGMISCYLKCPNDFWGKIDKECSDSCDELFEDESRFFSQIGAEYSKTEIEKWEDSLETDKRTSDLLIKMNCASHCERDRDCLENCVD